MNPSRREALLLLVGALGVRDAALRRDECGDWRITGRLGHVYAVPGGFQMYFRGAPDFEELTTSQGWTWCKKAMEGFAVVTQDGDGEGCLFIDRLPTADEAEVIRDKLRIAKKREISEETRERLKATAFRAADERSPQKPASGAAPLPLVAETAGGLSLSLAPL